jgi:hypothetical protein
VSVVVIAVPFGVTLDGLKLQLASNGSPEQANVTVGLKLAGGAAVTVMVVCTLFPRITVRLDWAGMTTMSTTDRLTGEDKELAEFASPA